MKRSEMLKLMKNAGTMYSSLTEDNRTMDFYDYLLHQMEEAGMLPPDINTEDEYEKDDISYNPLYSWNKE